MYLFEKKTMILLLLLICKACSLQTRFAAEALV